MRPVTWIGVLFLAVFFLAGCNLFVSRGGEGQPCFSDNPEKPCSGDLVCVNAVCQSPVADGGDGDGGNGGDPGQDGDGGIQDAGDQMGDDGGDQGSDDSGADDGGGDPGPGCVDLDDDGHLGFDPILCPSGDDHCDTAETGIEHNWTYLGCLQCEDGDGDGYGRTCDKGPDCDDSWDGQHDGCEVKHFYRSVGPEQTGPLASATGSLTVSAGQAVFAPGLANPNIGVGDVIQYDANNGGGQDSLAFIQRRIGSDSTTFEVVNFLGEAPNDTEGETTDWSIYRAYTSLAKALALEENTGLMAGLRNFDDEPGVVKNLVENGRTWNIACYAGMLDTEQIGSVENWITSEDYYLRIFTPVAPEEVGVSQRHNGVWNVGAYILARSCNENDSVLAFGNNMTVHLDGLQISKFSGGGNPFCTGIDIVNDALVDLSNCLIQGKTTDGIGIFLSSNRARLRMWNNVIYKAAYSVGDGIHLGDGVTAFIYNNTIYDSNRGVYSQWDTSQNVVMKNNLAVDNAGYDYDVGANFSDQSGNNCSSDGTSSAFSDGGVTPCVVAGFVDPGIDDFHIESGAYAQNKGSDLSADPYLSFDYDIDGEQRPEGSAWDIGADEYH